LVAVLFARDGAAQGWNGRVDTLPSGTVVVWNPAQGVWGSSSPWRAVEDLRIGSVEGGNASAFGRISALAVDRAGRIYVLDQQALEVRSFAPDGGYLRTLGGKGGGPGEFLGVDGLSIDDSVRLWVSDPRSGRFSVFDSSGRFLRDYPREQPNGTAPHFVGGEGTGTLWDSWPIWGPGTHQEQRTMLVRFAPQADRDSVLLPDFTAPQWQVVRRQGTTTMVFNLPVPFGPTQLLAVDPRGGVWRAVSSEYRLTRLDASGNSKMSVVRQHRPLPVTRRERDRELGRYRRDFPDAGDRLDESLIPRVKPAMRAVLLDERGFLWVAPYAADDSAAIAFDVFDSEGRYLGAVPTPITPRRLRPVPVVRGNALYFVTTDEVDVQYVVRTRIAGRK
jgi:hypothetical protein